MYGDILYRSRDSELLVENREIFIPHLYLAHPRGWPRRNFAKMFDTQLERLVYRRWGEEIMEIYLAISIEYRHVTDRRTDGQNCYINIARQYADAR